eukprot:3174208-Prymnesium_polylepis.1
MVAFASISWHVKSHCNVRAPLRCADWTFQANFESGDSLPCAALSPSSFKVDPWSGIHVILPDTQEGAVPLQDRPAHVP